MSAHGSIAPATALGIDYAVSEDDMNLLWRAQHAATLLAALDHDATASVGISHDGPAAVAEYIAQDVLDVLHRAQQLGTAPTRTKGPDLI